MVKTLLIFSALATTVAAHAARVLEDVERSFELALAHVQAPAGATGAVTFRTCAECRTSIRRVTAATCYFVDGREVDVAAFARTVSAIRATQEGAAATLVGLFYDVESQRITRIVLERAQP